MPLRPWWRSNQRRRRKCAYIAIVPLRPWWRSNHMEEHKDVRHNISSTSTMVAFEPTTGRMGRLHQRKFHFDHGGVRTKAIHRTSPRMSFTARGREPIFYLHALALQTPYRFPQPRTLRRTRRGTDCGWSAAWVRPR